MQLTHHQSKFSENKIPIILICDRLKNTSNIGGIFRLCDAFGIEKLYLIGLDTPLSHKTLKASRATLKTIDYSIIESAQELISSFKSQSYTIFGLEITDDSREISLIHESVFTKAVWIIGNEIEGVSKKLLELCDELFHIQMHGLNSSMNVVAATSIALFCSRKAIERPF